MSALSYFVILCPWNSPLAWLPLAKQDIKSHVIMIYTREEAAFCFTFLLAPRQSVLWRVAARLPPAAPAVLLKLLRLSVVFEEFGRWKNAVWKVGEKREKQDKTTHFRSNTRKAVLGWRLYGLLGLSLKCRSVLFLAIQALSLRSNWILRQSHVGLDKTVFALRHSHSLYICRDETEDL